MSFDPVHVLPTAVRPTSVMVRGEGDFLFDHEGERYLDFVQGWAVNALGHASPVVADALARQARTLVMASAAFYNAPQLALSDRLAAASGLDHVFVCSTGAEANESAIKLARKWGSIHRRGAYGLVTTEGGFHGRRIEPVMAQHRAGVRRSQHEHRHELPVPRLERGMRIDVDLDDRRAVPRRDGVRRVAHLVAEVAVRAREERERSHASLLWGRL